MIAVTIPEASGQTVVPDHDTHAIVPPESTGASTVTSLADPQHTVLPTERSGNTAPSFRDPWHALVPNPAAADGATVSTGLDAPTDLDVDQVSDASNIVLTWAQTTEPDENQVFKDGASWQNVPGNETSLADTDGLAELSVAEYKVRAATAGETSDFSTSIQVVNGIETAADVTTVSYPTLRANLSYLNLTNATDLTSASFATLKFCAGNIIGGGLTSLTSISFPQLVSAIEIGFDNCSALVTASFPALDTALGNINFAGSSSLATVNFPLLATAGGSIDISSCTSLTTVHLEALSGTLGGAFFANFGAFATLSLPLLTAVTGDFQCADSALANLSLNSLQSVDGNFVVSDNDSLTAINVSNLNTVSSGGRFDISGCPALTALSAPNLTTVTGNLNFHGCTTLASVTLTGLDSCSDLTGYGTALSALNLANLSQISGFLTDFHGCAALVSVSLPIVSWTFGDNGTIDFSGCALNQASVDSILERAVFSGITNSTINLSGGTNASPSVAGLADKTSLEGDGNTVNVN